MQPRVLFLNPPGRRPYLRDSYCSKISKSGYLYHPVDLLVQWGVHSQHGWQGHWIDAITGQLTATGVFDQIRRYNPQRIIGLTGWVSLPEDVEFYRQLATISDAEIWLSGDRVTGGDRRDFSLFPRASGFILDYTTSALAETPHGRPACGPALFPADAVSPGPGLTAGERSLGILPWQEIRFRNYTYPFALQQPLATLITSTGCPFRCPFCISGVQAWIRRPLAEIEQELQLLDRLGYREIYIADPTLNGDRERFRAICELMKNRSFCWSAFVRLDRLDAEDARRAAQSGCHTLLFGVENGDEISRRRWGKPGTDEELRMRITTIRRAGIRTVGTFVLGLPGDGADSPQRTAELAVSLGLDFASFNAAVPRPGTILASHPHRRVDNADQSFGDGVFPELPPELQGRNLGRAIQQANRRFYLRPGYLLQRLTGIRSLHQLQTEVTQAIGLFGITGFRSRMPGSQFPPRM